MRVSPLFCTPVRTPIVMLTSFYRHTNGLIARYVSDIQIFWSQRIVSRAFSNSFKDIPLCRDQIYDV